MILSKHHSTVQSVYTNSLAISSNNCSKLGMSNERKFLSNDTHTSLLHKLQRLSWSIIRWGMACVEIIQISIWGTEKIVCWAAIYCGRIWTIVFDCLLFLTHAFFTPGASLCMLLIEEWGIQTSYCNLSGHTRVACGPHSFSEVCAVEKSVLLVRGMSSHKYYARHASFTVFNSKGPDIHKLCIEMVSCQTVY